MKLGVIGAIGGAGQGIMENARRRAEQEVEAERSRIDEARERRLIEYKAQIDKETREDTQLHDVDMVGVETGAQLTVRGADNQAAADRQGAQLDVVQSEGAAGRESAERIAGMRAAGSASEAELEALERFEPKTQTLKVQGPDGFPVEQDVLSIYDKDTKRSYIQQGDKFVAQGVDPASIRPANSAAIDALAQNPDRAVEFLEKYHYLPARFMEMLSNKRTNTPR